MRSTGVFWPVFWGVVAVLATAVSLLGLEPPRGLVDGLGAESYPDRVAAEKKLQSWAESAGEPAMMWLLAQHRKSGNPEIRRGSLAVLRSVVLKDLTNQRPGYVGILMDGVKLSEESGIEGYGVKIQTVNAGTPADKAGLRATDIILKLDGKGWTSPDAQDEFAARIGKMRGGDEIQLELFREGKTEIIKLKLAPRPWSAGIYRQRSHWRGEEEAENAAFQEWMKQRQAELPER